MKEIISRITDSELEILRVLWASENELTFAEIRTILVEQTDWEVSTIKTLLRRLCKKEVVLATKKEVFYYKALISEEEYLEYSTQSLIDRVFLGSAKNLVASLLGNNKLEKRDIEELREILKEGDKDE